MTSMYALWIPILLSAVIVFVASSLIHTVSPWHKNDYLPVPREDDLMSAFRALSIPPGDYMVPRAMSMAEMKSPEFVAKMEKGPVLIVTVVPSGPVDLGKALLRWFLYAIVVSSFAAYVASRALPPGAPYLSVSRFVGTVAFIGYSLALWQMSIWYHRSLSITLKSTVDGLIYALLTAGTFGWLWPR
jgi:hypothetical protein